MVGLDQPNGLRRPVLGTELLAGKSLRVWNQYRADFVCGISIGFLDEVRVDTKGRRRVRVTQTAAHRPHRYAFGQQTRRSEVPKIVETDAIHAY